MKDNFSAQSDLYSRYRPHYPKSLFDYVLSHVTDRRYAWDVGTGNGQVASELAGYFDSVYGTDISEKQILLAPSMSNVQYLVCPSENSGFIDNTFDLVTVAQAIHWFNFENFYKEVIRTSRPNAVIAVWGYSLLNISDGIDPLIVDFYKKIIGPYWDKERKYVDELYKTIPFPFEELKVPIMEMKYEWTLGDLEGYLNTWSSVQKYIRQNQVNPVPSLIDQLKPLWSNNNAMTVSFPIFMRLGKVKK